MKIYCFQESSSVLNWEENISSRNILARKIVFDPLKSKWWKGKKLQCNAILSQIQHQHFSIWLRILFLWNPVWCVRVSSGHKLETIGNLLKVVPKVFLHYFHWKMETSNCKGSACAITIIIIMNVIFLGSCSVDVYITEKI